jgi:hypothetical protein
MLDLLLLYLYELFLLQLADYSKFILCDKFCIQWLRPCMGVLERVIHTVQYNTTHFILLEVYLFVIYLRTVSVAEAVATASNIGMISE